MVAERRGKQKVLKAATAGKIRQIPLSTISQSTQLTKTRGESKSVGHSKRGKNVPYDNTGNFKYRNILASFDSQLAVLLWKGVKEFKQAKRTNESRKRCHNVSTNFNGMNLSQIVCDTTRNSKRVAKTQRKRSLYIVCLQRKPYKNRLPQAWRI